jgi:hypothetical protein
VRLSKRGDVSRELGVPLLPPAHVAQVHEECHSSVVVTGTFRRDECIDALPRLTFPLCQISQISVTGCLMFALTPRAFARLTFSSVPWTIGYTPRSIPTRPVAVRATADREPEWPAARVPCNRSRSRGLLP